MSVHKTSDSNSNSSLINGTLDSDFDSDSSVYSLQGSHLQDEITQGTFASLVADHPEAAGSSGSSSSGPQHHHILHHLHSLPTPQQPPSHTRSSPASLASSRGRESDEGGQGSKNSVGGKSPGMVMSVRTSPGGLRGMIPQSPGISLGGNSPGSGSPHLDTTSSPSGTPKSASGNSGSPLGTPLSSLVPSSLGSSSSPSSQSAAGQVRSASLLLYPSTVGAAALTCDICFKTFTSRSNLNKHKRVQHSGEEYVCPICKRSFKNRYYIKEHVLLCSTASQKKGITTAPDSMPASEELALPTDLSSTQPTDLTSSAQAVDLATSKSLSPT